MVNYLELQSPYDYTPALAPGLAYTIAFSLITIVHIVLAVKYKYWIALIALLPGGLLEILGWGGRVWSHYDVLDSNPFIMQLCCLILGPAFFSAWAYTVLGYCITSLGPAFSILRPKAYLAVFVSADLVCLVLQAIGGGMAAVAAENGEDTGPPTNIMLAGVLVQLVAMTAFTVLAIDFIYRVIRQKPYAFRVRSLEAQGLWTGVNTDSPSPALSPSSSPEHPTSSSSTSTSVPVPQSDIEKSKPIPTTTDRTRQLRKAKFLLAGEAFASAMIYARGVYRAIELAQGWTGELMIHEVYFVWLDGFPMILAYAAFAVLHPGWLIERK